MLNQSKAVVLHTAWRLARYFGTSAEFWIGLQKDYDMGKARAELESKIEKEVVPLRLVSVSGKVDWRSASNRA